MCFFRPIKKDHATLLVVERSLGIEKACVMLRYLSGRENIPVEEIKVEIGE